MKALSILPAPPTVGRIVHVTLSADLAAQINGDPAIRGNACAEGDVYPLIIARVWPKETYSDGLRINGQLILDGTGTHWMTSVDHGEEPGCWHWPHIEQAAELKAEFAAQAEQPLKQPSGKPSPDYEFMTAQECAQAADTLQAELRSARHEIKRLRNDLIIQGNLAQERGFEIQSLEARLADETAKLYDVTAQSGQYAETAALLRRENERLRASETHLIQERDRLIHNDCAKLHEQVQRLTAERDDARIHCQQTEARLIESQAREQAMSKKLAEVAALVTGL